MKNRQGAREEKKKREWTSFEMKAIPEGTRKVYVKKLFFYSQKRAAVGNFTKATFFYLTNILPPPAFFSCFIRFNRALCARLYLRVCVYLAA